MITKTLAEDVKSAMGTDLSVDEVRSVCENLLTVILEKVKSGEEVTLTNFLKFKRVLQKERTFKIPNSDKTTVKAERYGLNVKIMAGTKAMIEAIPVESESDEPAEVKPAKGKKAPAKAAKAESDSEPAPEPAKAAKGKGKKKTESDAEAEPAKPPAKAAKGKGKKKPEPEPVESETEAEPKAESDTEPEPAPVKGKAKAPPKAKAPAKGKKAAAVEEENVLEREDAPTKWTFDDASDSESDSE
jgi:nucleoid DNA-binding protein